MDRVLVVDDEESVLRVVAACLRNHFEVETVSFPSIALEMLGTGPEFAVIVSDLAMPDMDGIEFLERARKLSPRSVRVMLTGHPNLNQAIRAVNRGNIFRFLTKPSEPEVLLSVLEAATRQYHLEQAERDLLHKTLAGSVSLLSELLTRASPKAFGRSCRVRPLAAEIAKKMDRHKAWVIDLAAMLCQVGCIAIPSSVVEKALSGERLDEEEESLYQSHSETAYSLLRKIPRLEEVADTVRYQQKHFDGEGLPYDDTHGQAIPLGARILKATLDFDQLVQVGESPGSAIEKMRRRKGWYDPEILDHLKPGTVEEVSAKRTEVSLEDLEIGAVLAADLTTKGGAVLLAKGQRITESNKAGVVQLASAGVTVNQTCVVHSPA